MHQLTLHAVTLTHKVERKLQFHERYDCSTTDEDVQQTSTPRTPSLGSEDHDHQTAGQSSSARSRGAPFVPPVRLGSGAAAAAGSTAGVGGGEQPASPLKTSRGGKNRRGKKGKMKNGSENSSTGPAAESTSEQVAVKKAFTQIVGLEKLDGASYSAGGSGSGGDSSGETPPPEKKVVVARRKNKLSFCSSHVVQHVNMDPICKTKNDTFLKIINYHPIQGGPVPKLANLPLPSITTKSEDKATRRRGR